jgi:hypothetical protein
VVVGLFCFFYLNSGFVIKLKSVRNHKIFYDFYDSILKCAIIGFVICFINVDGHHYNFKESSRNLGCGRRCNQCIGRICRSSCLG